MNAAVTSRKRKPPFGKNAWLSVLGGLVMALAMAGQAGAYWTASGTGGGSGNAGTLGAPTSLSGTAGAGTVALSWNVVPPPGGSESVSYYVTRIGGSVGGSCVGPISDLSCTDSGLSAGGYSYTVTAVWYTWTATSSPAAVTLASGAADHVVFGQQPTNTVSGSSISPPVTVLIKDAGGNTVTSSTATVTIAIDTNPGPGTLSGTASVSAVAGVATFSNLSINTPATGYTLTAASSGLTGVTSGTFNITGAAASFTISTPGTQTAGTAFSISITAKDANGNTATGYAGSKCLTFSGPAASPWPSPNGTAPSYPAQGSCPSGQSAVTFTNGVAATVPLTLYDASPSTILTATDVPSGVNGSTGAFAVSAAPEAGIMLSQITTHPSPDVSCPNSIGASNTCSSTGEVANGGTSGNVLVAKLALEDQFGNVVVNNTGSSIVVALDTGASEGTVSPSTLSIPNGVLGETSLPFTLTRQTGNKTVTMTATATVNGTTQTLHVTLSFK